MAVEKTVKRVPKTKTEIYTGVKVQMYKQTVHLQI